MRKKDKQARRDSLVQRGSALLRMVQLIEQSALAVDEAIRAALARFGPGGRGVPEDRESLPECVREILCHPVPAAADAPFSVPKNGRMLAS